MKDSIHAELALKKLQFANLLNAGERFGREAFSDLAGDILRLEREIAAQAGEEYAVEYPLLTRRMAMSFRIRVLANDSVCALACDHGAGSTIVFSEVLAYKWERVSGAALESHRLHGRGVESLRSYEVKNSVWAESIEGSAGHYVLFFQDRCFEVLSGMEPQLCMFPNFAQAGAHGIDVLGE